MPAELPPADDPARQLPLPLAQLYRRARNALEPLERHQAAYYCWEAALKLLATSSLLAAHHAGRLEALSPQLPDLRAPSLGEWWRCCRALLAGRSPGADDPFAPTAADLFGKKPRADLPACAALHARLTRATPTGRVRLQDLFDRLVNYRNAEIGHGAMGMKQEEFYGAMSEDLLAALAELLARIDFLAGGQLIHIDAVRLDPSGSWVVEYLELAGEAPRRPSSPFRAPQGANLLPLPRRVYLHRKSSEPAEGLPALTPLHPLVIYHRERSSVGLYNKDCKGKGGEYLDHVHGELSVREDVAEELRQLLALLTPAPTSAPEPPAPAPAGGQGSAEQPAPAPQQATGRPQVVLLYKRHAQPDEQLLAYLERELASHADVFIDRHLTIGIEWARALEERVRNADALVLLLSAASVHSEMLAYEVQVAHDEAQKRGGRPRLLPVRLDFEGPLPPELAAVVDRLQYFAWRGPADNARLREQLLAALGAAPPAVTRMAPPLGTLPLDYPHYVVRPTDAEFRAALERHDSIVRIRGARQMGKTSLLVRGVQQARAADCKVVLADFQRFNNDALASIDTFFRTLGQWVADELDLPAGPEEGWSERRSANDNFQRFLRRKVLEPLSTHLVLALDEVDRLFGCPFASEVFGLFRSWHTARNYEPAWQKLTQVISYATEAYLFISDLNQSPFNVGTELALQDFTTEQASWLNAQYGSPLRSPAELEAFLRLVGGHPHLVNRGLYQMVQRRLPLAAFSEEALRDDGPFGDHLRRLLVLLARDEELGRSVREVLQGRGCPPATFLRLRSAGVLAGESFREARLRCELYCRYLGSRLP